MKLFGKRRIRNAQRLGVARIGGTAAAVRLSLPADGRPSVSWLWQAQPDGVPDLIRALKRAHGRALPPASLVLGRGDYALISTSAPDVPQAEWADALRWSLQDQVDFGMDEAAIDVLPLPEGSQNRMQRSCMAVAVPGDKGRTLALASDDEGLRWNAYEVTESALRNICALGETEGKAHALMVFGDEYGMLVVTYQGELLMARTIEVVANAVAGSVEGRGNAVGRAGLEVLRTLDTFERMHSQVQLSELTVALPAGAEGMVEVLGDLVYVPVRQLELNLWLDCKPQDEAAQALMATPTFGQLCALGAALREVGEARGQHQLQLLTAQQAQGPEPFGLDFGLKLATGVVGSVVVLSMGLNTLSTRMTLRAETAERSLAENAVQLPKGPPRPQSMGELEALRDTERTQRTQYDAIQRLTASTATPYSEYFKALARQAVGDLWITGMTILPNGQDLELSGRMIGPQQLPPYLARLGQEPQFQGKRFAQLEIKSLGEQQAALAGISAFSLKARAGGNARAPVGAASAVQAASGAQP
jgi:MSHA biogenesis protein MshI